MYVLKRIYIIILPKISAHHLHWNVWAAICFQYHPYIENTTVLSDVLTLFPPAIAFVSLWHNLIILLIPSSTLTFLLLSAELYKSYAELHKSYAFFQSTNMKNNLALCSNAFSASWHMGKIISTQPFPIRKPHYDSGSSLSATACNLCCKCLVTNVHSCWVGIKLNKW